jgi:hypothetical protein
VSLDLTNLSAVLQARIDALAATAEFRDLLLLSKAIEAAAGNAALSDVIAEGTAQVGLVNTAGATQVGLVNAAGVARIAAINALDALLKTGGTLTGPARSQMVALIDGPTITPDFNAGNVFSLTLAGNRTLANPSNVPANHQGGSIIVRQDATGNRTLSFGSTWKFPQGAAPSLSTTANRVDRLIYNVVSATEIHAVLVKDIR